MTTAQVYRFLMAKKLKRCDCLAAVERAGKGVQAEAAAGYGEAQTQRAPVCARPCHWRGHRRCWGPQGGHLTPPPPLQSLPAWLTTCVRKLQLCSLLVNNPFWLSSYRLTLWCLRHIHAHSHAHSPANTIISVPRIIGCKRSWQFALGTARMLKCTGFAGL